MGEARSVGILHCAQDDSKNEPLRMTAKTNYDNGKVSPLFVAAGVAVDGALFVAGGAVVFLLGDGG
jgi:hypothetical protein